MERRVAGLSCVAGLAILAIAAPELPAAVVWNHVVIRVYDTFGHSSVNRRRAIEYASGILTNASLEIEWRDCTTAMVGRAHRACRSAPTSGELVVRLMRARTGVTAHVLGESLVDCKTGRGTLATIYADRVDATALAARTGRVQALGRVMAHEIGHLLLGTSEHSSSGLMRSLLSPEDLRISDRDAWLFTSRQREYLQREDWFATIAPTPRKPFTGS